MDVEILKTFAGAGGIGGIALAVFFYLAKDIIAQALGVGRERAFKLLRLIIIFSTSLGLVSILAWTGIVIFEKPQLKPIFSVVNQAGYSIEDHERILKERLVEQDGLLERAHGAERQALQAETDKVNADLANLQHSFEEREKELAATKARLEGFEGAALPKDKLKEALAAIEKGDTRLADALLAQVDAMAEENIKASAEANYQRGHIAKDNIKWFEAFKFFDKAAGLQPENRDYLLWAGNLARGIGNYPEAQRYLEKNLTLSERDLPPTHPDLAESLNSLAGLYYAQGLYDKAEPLFLRDIEITEKALGNNHPELAASLNNLAGLYEDQGLYEKAEPLYLKSIDIREKVLGNNHPDFAISLNNLAGLYYAKGLYEKAEPLIGNALKILQNSLPAEHPYIKQVEDNLKEVRAKMAEK